MKVLLYRLLTKSLHSHAVIILDDGEVQIKQSHRPFRSVTLPAEEARALAGILISHFAATPETASGQESEVSQ